MKTIRKSQMEILKLKNTKWNNVCHALTWSVLQKGVWCAVGGNMVSREMLTVKKKIIFKIQSFNGKNKGKIMTSLCSWGKKTTKRIDQAIHSFVFLTPEVGNCSFTMICELNIYSLTLYTRIYPKGKSRAHVISFLVCYSVIKESQNWMHDCQAMLPWKKTILYPCWARTSSQL